jgi:tetratricopeptide (TPR) repeat protein
MASQSATGEPGWLRIAVLVLLVGVGAVSGVSAFAASLGRQLPGAMLGVWPPSGDAYARVATLDIMRKVSSVEQGIPDNLPERVAQLSRTALRLEPASLEATRNIGFYYASHGDEERAKKLMDVAYAESRRDAGVNLWLTQYYGRRGRSDKALRFYDATIRTNSAAAATLMQMMAQTLDKPGVVPAFVELLSASPPWLDDFWSVVLSKDGSLRNAYLLRRALHEHHVAMAPDHDGLLIEKLAKAGLREEAFALHDDISGRAAGRELLADSEFDLKTTYPPIGWKVAAESTFGSSIDSKAGLLEIIALPDAQGVAAQQLVNLRGGRDFNLRAVYDGAGGKPLTIDFACADPGAGAAHQAMPAPSGQTVRVRLGRPCKFAWVSVVIPRDGDSAGRSIRVRSVSLQPHAG